MVLACFHFLPEEGIPGVVLGSCCAWMQSEPSTARPVVSCDSSEWLCLDSVVGLAPLLSFSGLVEIF